MSTRSRHPPPTNVMAAIREGAKLGARARVETPVGGIPSLTDPTEDLSTPVGMTQGDRIEWRQQQNSSDVEELARCLGAQNASIDRIEANGNRTATAVEKLVLLYEKSDAREERRDTRSSEIADRREEREVTAQTAKRSSREKIVLALIGAFVTIGSIVGTYLVVRDPTNPTPPPRIPPAAGTAIP